MTRYDGLDREPQYVALTYTAELPLAKFESETLYTGGCHCGAVTIAFKTQAPLPKRHEHIQDCNCSICCRVSILSSIHFDIKLIICSSASLSVTPRETKYLSRAYRTWRNIHLVKLTTYFGSAQLAVLLSMSKKTWMQYPNLPRLGNRWHQHSGKDGQLFTRLI